jgi:hypothetical protein
MAVTRRQVRAGAGLFLLLGVGALIFDLVSQNPGQMRYVLGAGFLIGLSAIIFHQARA